MRSKFLGIILLVMTVYGTGCRTHSSSDTKDFVPEGDSVESARRKREFVKNVSFSEGLLKAAKIYGGIDEGNHCIQLFKVENPSKDLLDKLSEKTGAKYSSAFRMELSSGKGPCPESGPSNVSFVSETFYAGEVRPQDADQISLGLQKAPAFETVGFIGGGRLTKLCDGSDLKCDIVLRKKTICEIVIKGEEPQNACSKDTSGTPPELLVDSDLTRGKGFWHLVEEVDDFTYFSNWAFYSGGFGQLIMDRLHVAFEGTLTTEVVANDAKAKPRKIQLKVTAKDKWNQVYSKDPLLKGPVISCLYEVTGPQGTLKMVCVDGETYPESLEAAKTYTFSSTRSSPP